MKQKVLLFFPPYEGPPLGPPVCLLALASPLTAAGFRVMVVDGTIMPDFEAVVTREIGDAVCLGVSLLTGPMIRTAVKVARAAKALRPDLPVVFGGWHPSLLPEQTLKCDCVDVVVRGQGELTLVELAKRFAGRADPAGVRGASFKREGQIVHEP